MAHVPVTPAHAVVVVDEETYPGLQEQIAGCAAPPAHTLPAPHPDAVHVAVVAAQALELVAVEA
jgi:hypothetical protein